MPSTNIDLRFRSIDQETIELQVTATEPGEIAASREATARLAVRSLKVNRLDEDLPVDGPTRGVRLLDPSTPQAPQKIGNRLFKTLAVGHVGEILEGEIDHWSRDASAKLRWRFDFDRRDPTLRWLENLPWEILRHPSRDLFFTLHRRCSIVRALAVTHAPAPRAEDLPLRCVAVASSPRGLPALDLDLEKRRIKKALGDSSTWNWDLVSPAEPERIRSELLKGKVDVLHFMGHGYEKATGELGLVLETKDLEPIRLDGRRWAELVADVRPTLVVLNACHTAAQKANTDEPFHGVAHALVQAGVPAVLAMRRPISDRAAADLSRVLFSRWAAGDTVDEAVTEARKAIRRKSSSVTEWLIPALFLRGDGFRLVDRCNEITPPDKPPLTEGTVKIGSLAGQANRAIGADGEGNAGSLLGEVTATSVEGEGNELIGARRRKAR